MNKSKPRDDRYYGQDSAARGDEADICQYHQRGNGVIQNGTLPEGQYQKNSRKQDRQCKEKNITQGKTRDKSHTKEYRNKNQGCPQIGLYQNDHHWNHYDETGNDESDKAFLAPPRIVKIPGQKKDGTDLCEFGNLDAEGTNPEPPGTVNYPAENAGV